MPDRLHDEISILGKLLSGSTSLTPAWEDFLESYSHLFLKVIWQFEKDLDKVMETYLYVCSRFSERDFAILHKFRREYGENPPKFTTWLGAVVRNMCVDAFRMAKGRRRYPKALLGLSALDRKVFELHFWQGYSLEEISATLHSRHNGAARSAIVRIQRFVRSNRSFEPTIIPFDDTRSYEMSENSREHGDSEKLEEWLSLLDPRSRLILRLRFWEGMSAADIARILQISPMSRVYALLQNALKTIRDRASLEETKDAASVREL